MCCSLVNSDALLIYLGLNHFLFVGVDPENWLVYRVWWGRKESMAGDLNGIAGVNIYSAVHPVRRLLSPFL